MQLESKKYLYDIAMAAASAMDFIAGKNFSDYTSDLMLRSAVERQLEIVGEALAQLARTDVATASQVSEHKGIIAFRNILITVTPMLTIVLCGTCCSLSCRLSATRRKLYSAGRSSNEKRLVRRHVFAD